MGKGKGKGKFSNYNSNVVPNLDVGDHYIPNPSEIDMFSLDYPKMLIVKSKLDELVNGWPKIKTKYIDNLHGNGETRYSIKQHSPTDWLKAAKSEGGKRARLRLLKRLKQLEKELRPLIKELREITLAERSESMINKKRNKKRK